MFKFVLLKNDDGGWWEIRHTYAPRVCLKSFTSKEEAEEFVRLLNCAGWAQSTEAIEFYIIMNDLRADML